MLLLGDSMQRTVRTVFFLLRPRLLASASRGAVRGRGAIVMLCRGQSFLWAPFWGFNAAHREDGVFSFTPTATRKREPWA